MAPRGAICTSACQNQNRVLTGVYERIYTVANRADYQDKLRTGAEIIPIKRSPIRAAGRPPTNDETL
jgi:hypothetical protein